MVTRAEGEVTLRRTKVGSYQFYTMLDFRFVVVFCPLGTPLSHTVHWPADADLAHQPAPHALVVVAPVHHLGPHEVGHPLHALPERVGSLRPVYVVTCSFPIKIAIYKQLSGWNTFTETNNNQNWVKRINTFQIPNASRYFIPTCGLPH